jgi:EmrB/QacA subfamily drug resistance transporter
LRESTREPALENELNKNKVEPSSILLLLVIMSAAQFIFCLDMTMMNVSIQTLVKDLNTTTAGIQAAITFYTLVMAAFMMAGAKVGDIIGRRKAFFIGLCIYGVGSLTTSLAPNLTVLIIGWSVLEGLGAALCMPAMVALVPANFKDPESRKKAFAVIPAAAAVGAAAGPIIGGFLTTYLTWRLGFFMEVLVVIFILIMHKKVQDSPLEGAPPKFDYLGVVFSASGLGILVYGIILAGTYGFFMCTVPYTINGKEVLSVGSVSPTVIFVAIGLAILAVFIWWESFRRKRGKDTLINLDLFKKLAVVCGVSTNLFQYFLMTGVMFSLCLFLQVVLSYDAFKTGLTILPLSITLFIVALAGARFAKRFDPKRIVQLGFLVMVAGAALLGLGMGKTVSGWDFLPAFIVLGAGLGLVASQINEIEQSAVAREQAGETSGLNYTSQNLGASLGTAIAGALIATILLSTSVALIQESTVLNSHQKSTLDKLVNQSVTQANSDDLTAYIKTLPAPAAEEVKSITETSQRKAVGLDIVLLAIMAGFGFLSTLGLPKREVEETVASGNEP